MKRIGSILALIVIVATTSGHIGSPDVFLDGTAGPYTLHVRVVPPTVVPGIAWVYVRTAETDIERISARPVYWRAGAQGAPPGERLFRSAGDTGSYSGGVWMMSRGAYSIYVDVKGARGTFTASVPVMSLATSRLGLSGPLEVVLIALGLLLLAGLVAITRAAASDSLVDAGIEPDQVARRRGSLAAIIAVPVLAILVFGGARWWKSEDTLFQRTIYRPLAADALVISEPELQTLRLTIRDTTSQQLMAAPLMPDHGKLMHLFLVKESSMSAFAHLHPIRDASGVFVTTIPGITGGQYLLFGDIVLETGAQFTVTTSLYIPPAVFDTTSDPDDSYTTDAFGVPAKLGARINLNKNDDLQWDLADPIVAGRDVDLKFSVRDRKGGVVPVEPYLGMAAHAVVIRDDASVFVHLHPMGTVAMASIQAFDQRDRGDTTTAGRLRAAAKPMAMPAMKMDGAFSFPYAFPKPGRYRVFVQVKVAGRVETAAYDVNVK